MAFSAAIAVGGPDLLLFDLLFSFSPFPAMAKSVFCSSLRCRLLIQNQKPPKEASRTTTTGTTIAGINVPRLAPPPEDGSDGFEDAAAVPEALAAAREADSEDSIDVYCAPSVTGTTPVESTVVAWPFTCVVIAKTPVAEVKVSTADAVTMSPLTGELSEGLGMLPVRSGLSIRLPPSCRRPCRCIVILLVLQRPPRPWV
jgi:hypothetical protein